jgi:hypothetical protein
VVREYLSGLIEGSRLTDAVAAWLHRLPGAAPPAAPDAEDNPDPTGPCDSCIGPGIADTGGLERAPNDLSTPDQGEEPGEEPEEPAVHEP